MSRRQTTGQNHYINVGNKSFENVAKSKYLETMLTNQNCIHEEIRSRLNSVNACYHAVQNRLSSRLLSKNVKIKTYKTIILHVVLLGVKPVSHVKGRTQTECLRRGEYMDLGGMV
jgi:hypothetical protein